MRSVREIAEEAKFDTNTEKSTRFTDAAMVRLFDSAQRTIQMVIFNAYPQDPIFSECKTYDVDGSTDSFKLPLNKMLTPNSIFAVRQVRSDGRKTRPMERLSLQEITLRFGYYLLNGTLKISPTTYINNLAGSQIELTYAPILKRITTLDQSSELPTICEEYLLMWVERKIHYIQSSKEISNSNIFTQSERADIASLFAHSARDPKRPPIGNEEYLAY